MTWIGGPDPWPGTVQAPVRGDERVLKYTCLEIQLSLGAGFCGWRELAAQAGAPTSVAPVGSELH